MGASHRDVYRGVPGPVSIGVVPPSTTFLEQAMTLTADRLTADRLTVARPAPPRRFLRALDRPSDAVKHLGPNWFAAVMGTGIIATAAITLPVQIAGQRGFPLLVWLGAGLLLTVLIAATVTHWLRHPAQASRPCVTPGHEPLLRRPTDGNAHRRRRRAAGRQGLYRAASYPTSRGRRVMSSSRRCVGWRTSSSPRTSGVRRGKPSTTSGVSWPASSWTTCSAALPR